MTYRLQDGPFARGHHRQQDDSAQLTRILAGYKGYKATIAVVPLCVGNAVLFVLQVC